MFDRPSFEEVLSSEEEEILSPEVNTKKKKKRGVHYSAIRHHYQLRGTPAYSDFFRDYFQYQKYFNFAIIKFLPAIIRNPKLLVPKDRYRDVTRVPFKLFAEEGFKGVIIDKENTLSLPGEYTVYNKRYEETLEQLKDFFPPTNVAIFSNTIGNLRYNWDEDYNIPDLLYWVPCPHWFRTLTWDRMELIMKRNSLYRQWRKLSRSGRKVRLYYHYPIIIHSAPKPDCLREVMEHFSDMAKGTVYAPEIVLVGDRLLTDIVLGNLCNMHTVLVDPIDPKADNIVVQFSRKFEMAIYDWVTAPKQNYKEIVFNRIKQRLQPLLVLYYNIKRIFFPHKPTNSVTIQVDDSNIFPTWKAREDPNQIQSRKYIISREQKQTEKQTAFI